MSERALFPRSGVTLVELLVVIAILGVMAGMAVIAVPANPRPVAADPVLAQLARARATALASGRPVTLSVAADSGPPVIATAYPDGTVIVDSAVGIDRLSGKPDSATARHGPSHAP